MIYYKIEEKEKGFRFYEPERNPDYNRKTEAVFAQCNGFLGIRASFETKQLDESRGTFIGGLYHKAGVLEVTELVNCPDVTEFRIRINGENLRLDSCCLTDYDRSLYTRYGELESRIGCEMKAAGSVTLTSRRFASVDNRRLFCHQLSVSCEKGGILELSTGINGQITNSGVSHFDHMEARVFEKKRMFLECGCDDGQILSVMTVCSTGESRETAAFHLERRGICQDFKKELRPGEVWTICKYTLFYVENGEEAAGKTAGQTVTEMTDVLEEAEEAGWGGLNRRHREAFDRFWDMAAIEITGASKEEGPPWNSQSIIWRVWFPGTSVTAVRLQRD